MGNKKAGLTLAEHKELGADLKEMHRRLGEITVTLSAAYPQRLAHMALRVQTVLGELRSKLDDEVCGEHPELPNPEVLSVYYGADDRD